MKPKTETRPENYEKMISESVKAETEANRAKAPTADRLRRRRPVVVYVLLVFQVSLFFFAAVSPSAYESLKSSVGLTPSQVMSGQNLHTMFTYMFFSPGVSDNLIFVAYIFAYVILLLIFGRGSESIFGGAVFLLFYLFCGFIGGLFHSAITTATLSPLADVPMLGATGSLFGVMASFGIFFPTRNLGWHSYYVYRELWADRHWIDARYPAFEVKIPSIIIVTALIILELTVTVFLFPRGVYFTIGNTTNTGGFLGGVIFSLLFRISGRGPWKKGVRPEIEYELAEPQQ